MFSILRPYIFSLDPEVAHDLAIKSLKANILPKSFFSVDGEEMLELNLFGKKISNPIGLAAGFDKSARFTTLFLNLVLVLSRWALLHPSNNWEILSLEYLD